MRFILRWGCLLIIALAAPIALPAGGGMREKMQIKYSTDPFICLAGESCFLFSSPYLTSSTLGKVDLGSQLNVIRIWQNEQGQKWLQVRQSYNAYFDINSEKAKRGWINV